MAPELQSQVKRKAERELPESEHPAKRGRARSADDVSTRRQHADFHGATTKSADDTIQHKAIDANGSPKNKKTSTNAQQRGDDAEQAVATPNDETAELPPGKDPAAEKSNAAGDPSSKREDAAPKPNPAPPNEDLFYARKIMQHLQLIIERWRLAKEDPFPEEGGEKQLSAIKQLCTDLFSGDKNRTNRFLPGLRSKWWDDMREPKSRLGELDEIRKECSTARQLYDNNSDSYDQAVAKRGDSYIGAADRSRNARKGFRAAVLGARQALRSSQKAWRGAEQRYNSEKAKVWPMINYVLVTAEKRLVYDDYLPRWNDGHSATPSRRERHKAHIQANPKDVARHIPEHSRYQSQRSGVSSRRDHRPLRENRSDEQTQVPTEPGMPQYGNPRSQGSQPSDYDDPYWRAQRQQGPAADIILRGVRGVHRANVFVAEHAYQRAAKQFHNVRNKYHGQLADFIRKTADGKKSRSRTDFDNQYYLTRGRANQDLALGHGHLEYAVAQADRTGALAEEQKALLFNDDVGEENEGVDPRQTLRLLQMLNKERVEGWLEREDEVVSESHWAELVSQGIAKGKTIGSVAELERQDWIATGEQPKEIDKWQKTQGKIRAREAGRFPPPFRYEVELQWYEGWNGL